MHLSLIHISAYFDAKDNVRSFLDGVPLVGAPLKKNITECKTLLRRAMYHSTTVSYTHLDVYKRQLLGAVARDHGLDAEQAEQ